MRRYLLWSALCCIMTVTTACGGCDEPEPGDNNTTMGENARPVARIEVPSDALVGNEVTASASGSSDADGDTLSYTWSLDTPDGSSAELSATDSEEVTFTPDVPGDYTLSLTVNDGTEESEVVTEVVTVGSVVVTNQPPVANAGMDVAVVLGERVNLDGSASSDPDGDDLTYAWEITMNSGDGDQMLSGEDAEMFSFTPSSAGEYVISLTVSDGQESSTDTVTVSVSDGGVNTAPLADAGADASVNVGEEYTFDGSASIDLEDDAEGTALVYAWEITTDPSNGTDMLVDSGTASPKLTPSVTGDYVVTLTVTDSAGESSTDTMTLSVSDMGMMNMDPVADAGAAQTVTVGDLVMLDGSASSDVEDDAAGTALTYAWTLTTDPSAGADVLTGADTATPGFTPSVAGDYVLSLTVTDSEGASNSAEVTITVQPANMNMAPVADAGPDQSVMTGTVVTLDGSGSTDAEDDAAGTALTYSWSITTDPSNGADSLTGDDTDAPTFTPSVEGTYVLTLTVTDSGGESSTDTVQIIVQDVVVDQPPVADAGADQTVTLGDMVSLDGSASTDIEDDAAGTALTYAWTITTDPSNGADTLTGDDTDTPTFTPSVDGTYVLTLTVTDSMGQTSTSTVTITVQPVADTPPVANAGEDRYVVLGSTISLDGSDSTDTEDDAAGTALTYSWSITMDPSNGTDSLTGDDTATPSITPSVLGMYELTVTVTDSAGQSTTDLVVVNVIEAPQVIIGERIEGSGSNKALEVYNFGTTAVDMAAVSVSTLSGANTTTGGVFNAPGSLAAGEVFVVCHSSRDLAIVTATCDGETGSSLNYNGDDVTVLYVEQDGADGFVAGGGDYILDVWGEIGNPPPSRIYNEKGYNRCDFTPFDGQSSFVYTSFYTENAVQNDFSDLGTPPVAGCGAVLNLPPNADAGPDQLVFVGDTVMLNGGGSTDPEDDAAGTALTYSWSITMDPSNGVDMLVGADTATPSIALSVAGTYEFTLEVTDSAGDMDSDVIEVIVRPPVVGNVPPMFISEIVEGSSSNKVVEFFNGSDVDIDLTNIHAVTLANGASTSTGSLDLTGTLAAGAVITVCNTSFDSTTFPLVPCTYSSNTVANFNGDDTTVIFIEDGTSAGFNPAEDTVIDAFGQIGVRPASNPYANETYERCDFTRYDGVAPFTAGRYDAKMTMIDDFTGIGIAPPVVNGMPVSTCPNSTP